MLFSVMVALVSALGLVVRADAGAASYDALTQRAFNSEPVATAYTTVTAEPAVVTVVATGSSLVHVQTNATTSASNTYDVLSDSFGSQNATLSTTSATFNATNSKASACSQKTTNAFNPVESMRNCTMASSCGSSVPSLQPPSTTASPSTVTSTTVIADSSPITTADASTSTFSNGMIPGFTAATTVNANGAVERLDVRHDLAGVKVAAIFVAGLYEVAAWLL